MTGVSAKGNDITLVAFCFFSTTNCFGDPCGLPPRGACLAVPWPLGFLIFEATGCSAGGALSPDRRADRLLLGAGSSAGGSGAGVFLRRVSLAAVASGGSEDWFAPRFLVVPALENMKPSRSSSYTGHDQHPIQPVKSTHLGSSCASTRCSRHWPRYQLLSASWPGTPHLRQS
jgi:hypothetical protein